jgi:hypothetical protein
MDWMEMGAPPPTWTFPTMTGRVFRRSIWKKGSDIFTSINVNYLNDVLCHSPKILTKKWYGHFLLQEEQTHLT